MRRIGAIALLSGLLFWLAGGAAAAGGGVERTSALLMVAGIVIFALAGDGSARTRAVAPPEGAGQRRPSNDGKIRIGVADQ